MNLTFIFNFGSLCARQQGGKCMCTLHPEAVAAAITGTRQHAGPLHFRHIDSLLKCPVVGVCLSLEEQRKLIRRAGMRLDGTRAFDVHELMVNLTDENSPLSRLVNNYLRKKYEVRAAPLRLLDMLAFMKQWDRAVTADDYAVELWAAATRPDLPPIFQRHIFGCVHMAMHDALLGRRAQAEQLRRMRLERAANAEKVKAAKSALSGEQRERQRVQRERDALLRQTKNLTPAPLPTPAKADTLLPQLHNRLEFLEQSLAQAHIRAHEAEKMHARAVEERDEQRKLALELHKEVGALLKASLACGGGCTSCGPDHAHSANFANSVNSSPCTECAPCTDCDQACASCAVCPRRILLVGGMTRMESLYRQLVEGKGDDFEYHDGYLGGVNTLEKSLQKADMVLCPVNCNSHRACLLVKSLCKKHKKTVHMMANFSLSAVSRIIERSPSASGH